MRAAWVAALALLLAGVPVAAEEPEEEPPEVEPGCEASTDPAGVYCSQAHDVVDGWLTFEGCGGEVHTGAPGAPSETVRCESTNLTTTDATAVTGPCGATLENGVYVAFAASCEEANATLGGVAQADIPHCSAQGGAFTILLHGGVDCTVDAAGQHADCEGSFVSFVFAVGEPFDCGAEAAGRHARADGPETLGIPVCVEATGVSRTCLP